MTKQEEIREGIQTEVDIIIKAGSGICSDCYTDSILAYLHSQGVVIKVDREFCPSPYIDNCLEDVGFNHCRNIHIEAGYVATDPLIEEVVK